jgi:hypothetical protein
MAGSRNPEAQRSKTGGHPARRRPTNPCPIFNRRSVQFSPGANNSVDWIDGIPTFDVFTPEEEPYHEVRFRNPGDSLPFATPAQVFDVMSRMKVDPRYDHSDMFNAAYPILEWAKATPELSKRVPFTSMVRSARYIAERGVLQNFQSPMLGTYKLTAKITGDSARTFYMRTVANTDGAWDPDDPMAGARQWNPPADLTKFEPLKGYTLLVVLGGDTLMTHALDDRQSFLNLPVRPATDSAGTRTWRLYIEGSLWRRPYAENDLKSIYPGPSPEGHLTIDKTGRATIDYQTRLRDGRNLTMHGERISLTAIHLF